MDRGIAVFRKIAVMTLLSPLLAIVLLASADAGQAGGDTVESQASADQLEAKWGIRVLAVRRTAEGYMLDFRYRIVDADKAAPLFSSRIKPYLIDEASGAVMGIPNVPKVGSLRSTRKPYQDRNYAMLFANPGQYIKTGARVTVVIGAFRAEHLVVE